MITVLWPCTDFHITDDWEAHLRRPGYNRAYAGTDLARTQCPLRPSQFGGKILQSMWSSQGYGYTTFVEYYDSSKNAVLRIRNAHQKNLTVSVGQIVQPTDNLGTLDSTGNSTGNHTHFEVWRKIAGQWMNIDPLNPKWEIKMVHTIAELVPIDETDPDPESDYMPPIKPNVPGVITTELITSYLNVRKAPFLQSAVIGKILPGVAWGAVDNRLDAFSNTWLRVYSGNVVGWAAAHYGGETWLKEIPGG